MLKFCMNFYIFRSKVVLRPDRVLDEEVHWPTVVVAGSRVVNLNDTDGEVAFYHYRACSRQYLRMYCKQWKLHCFLCTKVVYSEDASISNKFGKEVLQRVVKRMEIY